jgi:hypothetical protein
LETISLRRWPANWLHAHQLHEYPVVFGKLSDRFGASVDLTLPIAVVLSDVETDPKLNFRPNLA